jgi:23S rRNA (cytidine2498-2'-O)-methyltransferase
MASASTWDSATTTACTATGVSWGIRTHVAARGFARELELELGDAERIGDDLFLSELEHAAWAQNTWLAPEKIAITSIGDAAKKLRAIQRNWTLYPTSSVRRSRLIEAKLPKLKGKTLTFPEPPPNAPIGGWTLLDDDTMLASPTTSRPFPFGIAKLAEDPEPPSRAYLKLWEALTLMGVHPRGDERCLDLGSSPGGWTWVCAKLGATVLSVDKAELAPEVARMPGVTHRRMSAFALEPRELGELDWVLSDVICYPPRLLRVVNRFLEEGVGRRFVCTLKFQGETDHETARAFAAIEGSQLLHLSHNKHELTWMLDRSQH